METHATRAPSAEAHGYGFGTTHVFLASFSTILGAILFLRFGYAVGHLGPFGALLVVALGHLVTIPTALAIAEIATNRRVEGGGVYFIISRSFGITIGGTIGITLYLAQAVSIAFYVIAFAEVFRPLAETLGLAFDPRVISLPGAAILVFVMLRRGAEMGVTALYVVSGILTLSLILFFLGGAPEGVDVAAPLDPSVQIDPVIVVFAIIFPAFTGGAAGVGLSGDLANPRHSIPRGVLGATIVGLLVYVLVILKLASSASREMLVEDQLVMSQIAVWSPIILIGLAAATFSSALGSILIAPRTLQALANDGVIPGDRISAFLAAGQGSKNEPRNGTLVTGALAFGIVIFGGIDPVARIITMFFLVTYGALCAISFLEHFAARPDYRPSFRSRWYISLFGAVTCVLLMFQVDPAYAIVAILLMSGVYFALQRQRSHANDLSTIFSAVMIQLARRLQIRLQEMPEQDWRPSIIMVTGRTFDRSAPQTLLRWLCYRHGVGTYLHHIPGRLDGDVYEQSQRTRSRLIELMKQTGSTLYVDTIISPSMRSALAQAVQLPGAGGVPNNTYVGEFSVHDDKAVLEEIREGLLMAQGSRMNGLVLGHGDHHFGNRLNIHVWLTPQDYRNVPLMILLAYILLDHPDWRRAELSILAAYPQSDVQERTATLFEMITSGRIPISERNITIIPTTPDIDLARLVESRSREADLVLLGLSHSTVRSAGIEPLRRHPNLRERLWVSAAELIDIE